MAAVGQLSAPFRIVQQRHTRVDPRLFVVYHGQVLVGTEMRQKRFRRERRGDTDTPVGQRFEDLDVGSAA